MANAINLTPAQVATAVGAPVSRTPPAVVSPPLAAAGVSIMFYQSDPGATPPNALHAVVAWPSEVPQDLLVSGSVPAADLPALRVALGRLLVDGRAQAGAV